MSESSSEQQSSQTDGQQQDAPKTFDADYVKKLRDESARYRTEAKSNADAAKRLADIENAQKSESEKTAERIAKAESEVSAIPSRVASALREHLVALHEIDKDDAELFLTGNEPELLLKQVTRLLGQSDKRKKNGNHVPNEGKQSQPQDNDLRAFARELFSGGDPT